MKTTMLLALTALLAACGPIPATGPNPLDRLEDGRSIKDIRREHMRAITGNPGYR